MSIIMTITVENKIYYYYYYLETENFLELTPIQFQTHLMLLLRASVFTPPWAGVSTSAAGCGLTPLPSPTGAGVTGLGSWSLVTPCHHQRWEHQLIQMPVSVSASNLKKKSNIDLLPHIMQLCMLMICKFDCKSNVASNTWWNNWHS